MAQKIGVVCRFCGKNIFAKGVYVQDHKKDGGYIHKHCYKRL